MSLSGLTTSNQIGVHKLLQPKEGYRFSVDSILLASFATIKKGPVVDLGAGSGILSLLLAGRGAGGPFTAVELNHLSAQCCRENLAPLHAVILEHDLRQPHVKLPAQGFNMVISNPPFTSPEHGRVSPQEDKAQARHQLSLTLPQLWKAAARLLPPKGRLAFCLPPRLLDQALAGLLQFSLAPKRLRLVHGRLDMPAKIALLECVKDAGPELKVEAPLIMYKDRFNTRSRELEDIYNSFN